MGPLSAVAGNGGEIFKRLPAWMGMARHLLAPADLDNDRILEIFKRARAAEAGKERACQNKVLGLLFMNESTRTSNSLKSGIIKGGGGWLGMEGTTGSYIASGEENVKDTALSIASTSDILAVRGPLEPEMFQDFPIPVVNAMMGDDHVLAALWWLYSIWKRYRKLKGLRIGVYGMTRYSRPVKSFYRVASKLGMEFYEDGLIEETGSLPGLVSEIEANGSGFERGSAGDFISRVDVFIVAEALPQKGADKAAVKRFNHAFRSVDEAFLRSLNPKACWFYVMPRATTDGRLTTPEGLDAHPQCITQPIFVDSVYCNIGVYAVLLGSGAKKAHR